MYDDTFLDRNLSDAVGKESFVSCLRARVGLWGMMHVQSRCELLKALK